MEINQIPDISVIMPCYNADRYLETSINSIINSSIINVCELVIVNDGSTDSTEIIVERIRRDHPSVRIKYKKIANSGVSIARNVGIELAEGKYIIFIDSDDIISPFMLESLFKGLSLSNAEICFCHWTDKEKRIESRFIEPREIDYLSFLRILLYRSKPVGLWSVMFVRQLLDSNSIRFSGDIKYGEDLQFLWRASIFSKKVVEVDAKYYYYRPSPNSAMRKTTWRKVEIIDVMQHLNNEIFDINPLFAEEFQRYMIPRTVLSLLKDFSQSKSRECYEKLIKEYDCKHLLKSIKAGGITIRGSAALFCFSPSLFYMIFSTLL